MKLNRLVTQLATIGLAAHAGASLAQNDSSKLDRVEVTGSSIKRVQDEGALPVQVITRSDMDRAGIVTAEQLLSSLSANGSGAYNMSTQQGSFVSTVSSHAGGASSANLRGLGPENTLVLLNGRRTSTHGLNGKSVDLNSIPLGAVERVEVLKDGASAIYGTDAIGGVINFILRRDYVGLEATAFADITQEGGGHIAKGSVLFGHGKLDTDGFNVMVALAVDGNTRLRGGDRAFQNGYQPERGLAPDTTGTSFATQNITFKLPGDAQTYSRANLLGLQGKCDTVPGLFAYPTGVMGNPNFAKACAYDYGADTGLMQPVQRTNLVSRGTFKINDANTAFVEVVASRTTSKTEYTRLQFSGGLGFLYPAGGPYYQDLAAQLPALFKSTDTDPTDPRAFYDNTKDISIRWRCVECGTRKEESTADTYRVLAGLEGTLAGWDYKTGLSVAGSKASTDLIDGYVKFTTFKDALYTGKINPWLLPGQTQTAEAMALIEASKIRGPQFGGKTGLVQLDGSISRELWALPGGPLAVALGFDLRRESYNFAQSTSSISEVFGAGDSGKLDKVKRSVSAVYGELALPLLKSLEAQLAVRHDRYSVIGGSTNPKIALRYQPVKSFALRGSWNTGFHVPDFEPLYGSEEPSELNNPAADPVLCPTNPGNPTFCNEKFETRSGSNPNLTPEKSKQWTFGFVASPMAGLVATVDLWNIKRTNRIRNLLPEDVLANYQVLGDNVVRKPDGTIAYIRGGWINVADDITRGVDVGLKFSQKLGGDRVDFGLEGTYFDSHKSRLFADQPYVEEVGQFGATDVYLRWKHQASVTWRHGSWTTYLSQNYSSSYRDQPPPVLVPGFNPKVKSYTLYNLSLTYTGLSKTTLTAGVRNLLDKDPPFSAHNVDLVAGAGWDARVADPRGRSFTLIAKYQFY